MFAVKSPGETWTVGRLLNWTAEYLKERGSETARLDAEVLLAHTLECERIQLYTRFDEAVADERRASFRELVRRRAAGSPVAYLVGHKEFFSLDFFVSPAVLIPRPESEFVVMECLRLAEGLEAPLAVDVGTGSGNIAIGVAYRHRSARVIAIDRSADALAIARKNAERHGVASRMQFLQGDLLEPLAAERPPDSRPAFILSNPPYIATAEIANLPVGVRDYEPHSALDGGPDGLAVVGRLIEQARFHLQEGGHLILEIGAPQETAVRELIEQYPEYRLAPTVTDYSRHPRVVRATRTIQ